MNVNIRMHAKLALNINNIYLYNHSSGKIFKHLTKVRDKNKVKKIKFRYELEMKKYFIV